MAMKAWSGSMKQSSPSALVLGPLAHQSSHARFNPGDEAHYRRLMQSVWNADSEAVLEALRQSPLREIRPQPFHALFGYMLGNREAIDNWRLAPATLRRLIGRRIAPVRWGSGGIEKNIKVQINRCFKRQGRSWKRAGAGHSLNSFGFKPTPQTGTIGGRKLL